jgi:hypothetical protein
MTVNGVWVQKSIWKLENKRETIIALEQGTGNGTDEY